MVILTESLLSHGTDKLFVPDQEIKPFFREIPDARGHSFPSLTTISNKCVDLNGHQMVNSFAPEAMIINYTFGTQSQTNLLSSTLIILLQSRL